MRAAHTLLGDIAGVPLPDLRPSQQRRVHGCATVPVLGSRTIMRNDLGADFPGDAVILLA
eukprot:COSAG01_NODE_4051_length_5393_cov_16.152626_5_plen_60_part_00